MTPAVSTKEPADVPTQRADDPDDSPSPSSPAPTDSSDDSSRISPWNRLAFGLTHLAVTILLRTLSLSGLYRFAQLFGTLEWTINFKRRRRFAQALLRVLVPPPTRAQRRRWSRDHFMQTRCDKLFYLIFDRIPREQALGLFTITNQPLLDQAHGRGRGVYMAMSHHGAHHVVALLTAMRGYKVAGVRDRREGALRRYVQTRLDARYPELGRMRVLFADSYPREIYRCFRENYLLGSAMDVSRVRSAQQKTTEVTVFGEQRAFLSGPLRIAHRCKTPVLQAFVVSEARFHYRLEIVGWLMDPEKELNEEHAVEQAMRTYAANVEQQIRATPSLITRL